MAHARVHAEMICPEVKLAACKLLTVLVDALIIKVALSLHACKYLDYNCN